MLTRTFGCVRVVWNRTLAARHARWHAEGKSTSYAETDRALTAMKKDPGLAFLGEVGVLHARRRAAAGQDRLAAAVRVDLAGRGRDRAGPGDGHHSAGSRTAAGT
jgi:hypothetical protein